MIRPLNDELYQVLCGWWERHGWGVFPQILSKRGFVSFVNETPVVAGFLYKDETCSFGMLEFVVSNPDATKEEKVVAFEELFRGIKEEAKRCGVSHLFTASNHPGLINRLKGSGFIETQGLATHLYTEV